MKNIIKNHMAKSMSQSMTIAVSDFPWWVRLLLPLFPWRVIFKRGFYSGVAYSAVLQDKGHYGKAIIKAMGAIR